MDARRRPTTRARMRAADPSRGSREARTRRYPRPRARRPLRGRRAVSPGRGHRGVVDLRAKRGEDVACGIVFLRDRLLRTDGGRNAEVTKARLGHATKDRTREIAAVVTDHRLVEHDRDHEPWM